MSRLFEPFDLHGLKLANRVVMAPMTRSRASVEGIPHPRAAEYYAQRASAGLIVTEATAVSQQGSGYAHIPGIWTQDQTQSWKQVVDAVHQKGGKIFIQLFHTGRVAHRSLTGEQPVSSTNQPPDGEVMAKDYSMQPYESPRILREDEIPAIVAQFRTATKNAVEAGFDGIEIHAANGYLLDQFLRDGTNLRTDSYGGTAANRARLLREVIEAVLESSSPYRVGVRLSPWSGFNSMRDSNPPETYRQVAEILNKYPLAYIHMVEQNVANAPSPNVTAEIRKICKGTMVVNEGLTRGIAENMVDSGKADLACFGKPYISNPDLVERLKNNLPLTEPDFSTFYVGGDKGYIDYPIYSKKA